MPNLLAAWKEFKRGKSKKSGVSEFAFRLEDHLVGLHERLSGGVWTNDPYVEKPIADPKPRLIHIASVRDRVLYQAVYRLVYPIFDRTFIHDSYASRAGKGVLAGVLRLEEFVRKASRNYSRPVFILKCDIRKFFDSIDHCVLFGLLKREVDDPTLLELLRKVVSSFEKTPKKGLPLGNVTSQLFANVYLNELDQYVKRELKARFYIRYCDDFVIVGQNYATLQALTVRLGEFLGERLRLSLHPRKVSIRKLEQGVDFLGYVTLSRFRVLRTRTRRRMFSRTRAACAAATTDAEEAYAQKVLQSYKGLLSHSREYRTWKLLERLCLE